MLRLRYIEKAMSTQDHVRKEVLAYLREQAEPVRVQRLANELRDRNPRFSALRDSDFRDVVQPMIVTGRVHYTTGLKVQLDHKAK